MREKARRLSRRSGPKQSIPDTSDSTYYSIETTEEIYGTTLLPSQRCYIDPWDLENYDYVRKKLGSPSPTISPPPTTLDSPSTPSPAGQPISSQFYYLQNTSSPEIDYPMDSYDDEGMGLDEDDDVHNDDIDVEEENDIQTIYKANNKSKYDQFFDEEEHNLYNAYRGEFESSSSTERNSVCGDESVSTLMLHTPGFGAVTRRRGVVLPKPAPKLEFPAPPPTYPSSYEYCIPYGGDNGYCSVSDCYECLSQCTPIYGPASSMIYGSSIYGGAIGSYYGRKTSSIYSHSSRFGLSKKGLLQIDYSCNWNDLDRMIGKADL